jgi:hypothetical protein
VRIRREEVRRVNALDPAGRRSNPPDPAGEELRLLCLLSSGAGGRRRPCLVVEELRKVATRSR